MESAVKKLYTREEARRRKVKYQIFAGMYDFIAVIIGVAVLIACVILISALVRWVIGDAPLTFKSLWNVFTKALIVPE